MKIAIANDHSAVQMKNHIKAHLEKKGHTVVNFGTEDETYSDYPIYAARAAHAVANGECDLGIVICGTGIGVMLAANKVKGAYAANVDNVYAAKRACLSNNCNIITIGCQTVGNMLAKELISAYLDCEYVYNERSGKKVDAIVAYEQSH